MMSLDGLAEGRLFPGFSLPAADVHLDAGGVKEGVVSHLGRCARGFINLETFYRPASNQIELFFGGGGILKIKIFSKIFLKQSFNEAVSLPGGVTGPGC